MPGKKHKQHQVVADHASPGCHQAQSEAADTDKGAGNPDCPHTGNVIYKGSHRPADALHQAFHDNGNPIEGFRHGYHAQHGGTQPDDVFIAAEDPDQRLCKQEKKNLTEDVK